MKKPVIKVNISSTEENLCAYWVDNQAGVVIVTAQSLEQIKADFIDSLKWHIEGCLADGDSLPDYLTKGDYELVFDVETNNQVD